MKRIVILLTSIVGILACGSIWAIDAASTSSQLQTQEQKLSYALGVATGMAFKSHEVKIDTNTFATGMADALQGRSLQLSATQMSQIIQQFQEQSVKH